MSRETSIKEHDYEPVPGLPAYLPAGETILWQGAPHWRALAVRAMHIRVFAIYFAILVVWGVVGGASDGRTAYDIAVSALRLTGLACVAIGLLTGYAWLAARSTMYTITTRRVVMRFGIALPITIQIAYPMIDGAGVSTNANGAGDIALTLRKDQRVAYMVLWPHARPFRMKRSEPAFRGIQDAASVAKILGRALAASASQPAKAVSISVGTASSASGAPVAAAA
jgi:hypothetical protein